MKKISFTLVICTISIFANGFETNYISELNLKKMPENVQKIIDSDEKYQLAIKQLTQKEFMATREISSGDPHKVDTQKKTTVTIPNFKEAYKNLKDSYTKTKNPLSSYVLIHLIKTAFGKNSKLEDFSKYSKANYENGVCSGYIDYGETLQNGYFVKKNKQKAIEVYTEGLKKCKEGWYGSILSSKLLTTKR